MEFPRVLIVEDEPKVAAFIKKGLEENSYIADVACDGITGKDMVLSGNYDLVILDINLPQLNGFQLCKLIRNNNLNLPIIMLTALGGIEQKIKGFDYGADDYLLKPFEFKELLARIKALLKRANLNLSPQKTIIKIANLEINTGSKRIKRDEIEINLTAKEFMLLEYLAINKGKVISRMELSKHVWDINFDTGTNVIDVYVNFLRKKMDNNFSPKLIHTRIGHGYILTEAEN